MLWLTGTTLNIQSFMGAIMSIGVAVANALLADEIQYEAETEVSHTNYDRMAEARQKSPDLIVPQTVDDLRGAWEVAQAKLQRTRTLLQFARLVAPFTGADYG
jgi:hypothetical protein